jgi:hypothetical protein
LALKNPVCLFLISEIASEYTSARPSFAWSAAARAITSDEISSLFAKHASATVERMVRGLPKLVISVFKSLGENVLILFLSIMPNEIFETLYSRFEDCNSSLANSTKIPKISPLNSNVARSFDDHLNGKATMSKISFNNPLILFPSPDSWSTIKS